LRRVILHVQLVNDEVFRSYVYVAGGRVGTVIVDDALATPGVDGVIAVDERGRQIEFRIVDFLGSVRVWVVENEIAIQHGAERRIGRGRPVTGQAVHVKRARTDLGAADAHTPVAGTVADHRQGLRRRLGVRCIVDQQLSAISRGRAQPEVDPPVRLRMRAIFDRRRRRRCFEVSRRCRPN